MPRRLFSILLLAIALAACAGSGAATQGPVATSGGGGGATATNQPPQATETATESQSSSGGGGGGGSLDTSHGKAHIDLTGVVTKSVDLGFQPVLSHFGGMEGTVLYFVPTGSQGALTITQSGGEFVAVYTSTDVTVTGIECTATNLNIGATSATGSFECPKNAVVLASGASAESAGFKGTFEAHG